MAILFEKRNLCGLIIDAAITESHTKTAVVTEENIASAASVADHMRASNPEINLRAIISDYPPLQYNNLNPKYRPSGLGIESMPILDEFDSQDSTELTDNEIALNRLLVVNNTGLNHFGSIASTFDYSNSGSRTKAAWTRLNEIMDDKEVCRLVTDIKVYDEVVVTNISTERNRENIDKLDVNITLKQIKRVSAKEDTIQIIQSKGTKNLGTQESQCLTFNQVFTQNVERGQGGERAIQSGNIQAQSRTLSSEDYDQICARIATRYSNLKINDNEVVTRDVDGKLIVRATPDINFTGLTGIESFRAVREQSREIKRRRLILELENKEEQRNQGVATSACNNFYAELSDNQLITCRMTEACGDTAFNPPTEQETEAKDAEGVLSQAEAKRRQDRAELDRYRQGALDPTTQQINQIVIQNQIDARREIERSIEDSRVNCYTDQVLKFLTENNRFDVGEVFRNSRL